MDPEEVSIVKQVFLSPKERRNFALFLSGRSVSGLMSSVYAFAMGLYVLKMTGSGLSFAVTLSLQILPAVLIGPFGGVLADKFDKKRMVIAADAFGGVMFLTLFFLCGGGLTIGAIYAATLLLAVSQTVYNVCVDAAVPGLVSGGNILRLNAFGRIVDSAATVAGPAIGGMLYGLAGIRIFILLSGAAFLFSTLTECLTDFRLYEVMPAPGGKPDLKKDFAEGIRYIGETGWLTRMLLNFLAVNFVFSLCYSVPVPYVLTGVFRLSARVYGAMQCFMPCGMAVGALLVTKLAGRLTAEKLMARTGVSAALCLAALGALPVCAGHVPLPALLLCYGFFLLGLGVLVALIDIPFINSFQTRVPERIRGRALSIAVSAVKALTPAGYLLSGAAMRVMPAAGLTLGGGAALALFYLLCGRHLAAAAEKEQ